MSELLNIWREIGSYNRFAETKNAILLGLLAALLGLMTKDHSEHFLFIILFGGNNLIFLLSIVASLVVCLLTFFPILHYPSIFVGEVSKSARKSYNPYYFYDIAAATTGDEWLEALSLDLPAADKSRAAKLVQQIWVVARIARRKFVLFRVSATIVGCGWAISWGFVLLRQP